MKISIPFYFIILFILNVNSQETIRIPDIGLEECLIDLKIDSNGLNGSILVSDAKYVVNLNINNPITNKLLPNVHSKIKDLTGLESFPNLKRLDCFDNNITKLDLSKSTSITFLNCNNNKITKLDLSKNTELTYVSCDNNKLNNLIIGNNTELESLYTSFNKLTYLDVKGCTKLKSLDASGNKINTILVNKTQLNNIPTGWYKDNKAVYSTTKKNTSNNIKTTIVTTTTTTTTTQKPIIKNYSEKIKQQIVKEFEAAVLNEAYLESIKNKLTTKHGIPSAEISKWIKTHNKRINYLIE
ncbi:hypothetical protein [Tenacibaculum aestuariivivum]|uniref:hypothetical protein n=1 Tax=Tenacibaculum aestuariivivum TaxID=2006131 RepID=UPI003AB1F4AF